VTLWEGQPDCGECQARAVTLWPDPPPRITLRRDSTYTAQLEMQPSGDSDACIYKFVSNTWSLPQIPSFDCTPEQEVMRRSFSTRRDPVPPRDPDLLFLRVDRLCISRPFGGCDGVTLLEQQYPVDWMP
jgi:hypothetical protein